MDRITNHTSRALLNLPLSLWGKPYLSTVAIKLAERWQAVEDAAYNVARAHVLGSGASDTTPALLGLDAYGELAALWHADDYDGSTAALPNRVDGGPDLTLVGTPELGEDGNGEAVITFDGATQYAHADRLAQPYNFNPNRAKTLVWVGTIDTPASGTSYFLTTGYSRNHLPLLTLRVSSTGAWSTFRRDFPNTSGSFTTATGIPTNLCAIVYTFDPVAGTERLVFVDASGTTVAQDGVPNALGGPAAFDRFSLMVLRYNSTLSDYLAGSMRFCAYYDDPEPLTLAQARGLAKLAYRRMLPAPVLRVTELIGEFVGQPNYGFTEENYQRLIRARSRINLSNGTRDDILDVVRFWHTGSTELELVQPGRLALTLDGDISDLDRETFLIGLRDAKGHGISLEWRQTIGGVDGLRLAHTDGTLGNGEGASAQSDIAEVLGQTPSSLLDPVTLGDALSLTGGWTASVGTSFTAPNYPPTLGTGYFGRSTLDFDVSILQGDALAAAHNGAINLPWCAFAMVKVPSVQTLSSSAPLAIFSVGKSSSSSVYKVVGFHEPTGVVRCRVVNDAGGTFEVSGSVFPFNTEVVFGVFFDGANMSIHAIDATTGVYTQLMAPAALGASGGFTSPDNLGFGGVWRSGSDLNAVMSLRGAVWVNSPTFTKDDMIAGMRALLSTNLGFTNGPEGAFSVETI